MSWVKHELKEVGLVTLYFLSCFGIILTLRKLFLADYQIKVYALSAAVVGALMAAKIALLLGHTRAGTRFDVALTHHAKTPLGWHALFYPGGFLHVSKSGDAWSPMPWRAVQRVAWMTLSREPRV